MLHYELTALELHGRHDELLTEAGKAREARAAHGSRGGIGRLGDALRAMLG